MIPVLITMIAFSILHSLSAGDRPRAFFRRHWGDRAYHGLYRLIYNLFAALTLVPVFLALLFSPGAVIWSTESPVAFIFIGIQLTGLIGLLISLLQIDLARFAGLRQFIAYVRGEPLPLPAEPLQLRGVYQLVRHPLYLFSLLVIWPGPIMTEGLLAFNIAATLYFIVGSLLEERRMIAQFGQAYIDYQRRTPWIIPFPRRSLNSHG